MSQLTERLRDRATLSEKLAYEKQDEGFHWDAVHYLDAAREIERLTAALVEIEAISPHKATKRCASAALKGCR